MLSRAVASVFFEEHRPQKLPIHGLYGWVARDSCLPCKRYCRAASRATACRAPVTLLVASRVNVPFSLKCAKMTQILHYGITQFVLIFLVRIHSIIYGNIWHINTLKNISDLSQNFGTSIHHKFPTDICKHCTFWTSHQLTTQAVTLPHQMPYKALTAPVSCLTHHNHSQHIMTV